MQSAVSQNNLSSPGGTALQGPTQFDLSALALLTDIKQFNDIVVNSGPSGNFYFEDVARVEDTEVVPVVYTLLEDIFGWACAIAGLPRRLLRRRVEAHAVSIAPNTPRFTLPAPTDDDEA